MGDVTLTGEKFFDLLFIHVVADRAEATFLAAIALSLAFGAGAATYLLAALAIFLIAGTFKPIREGPPTRIHQDIAEGLRYLFGHPLLRVLAAMVGISNLASSAVFSLIVLYAVAPGPLGLDEVGFGLLLTGSAIGSLIGTFVTEPLERLLGRANLLAVSIAGFGVPMVVLSGKMTAERVRMALGGAGTRSHAEAGR